MDYDFNTLNSNAYAFQAPYAPQAGTPYTAFQSQCVPDTSYQDSSSPDFRHHRQDTEGEPDAGAVEQAVSPQRGQVPDNKEALGSAVKTSLISMLEEQGIILDISMGQPKLPWTRLRETLKKKGLEIVNWPEDVPLTGKGISGLPVKHLQLLYDAINDKENPLHIRPIQSVAVSAQYLDYSY